MQAALSKAGQQLAQIQLETVAKQAKLDTQQQELIGLRKLAEAHTATIASTAKQAEESQQQLMATVTSLKVTLIGKLTSSGCVTYLCACLATCLGRTGPCRCLPYCRARMSA